MGKKQPNIFKDAKPAPPPTEEEALDSALYAVQTYLSMVKGDEEKIDDFNSLVDTFCWDARKEKKK